MSALMVLLGVLYPIGSILQGWIADDIGLRATTAGAAVLLARRAARDQGAAAAASTHELRDPPAVVTAGR